MTPAPFSTQTQTPGRLFLTLSLVVALSGCTNIKNDRQRTRTEGAVSGAAGGAVLGAAAGALLGGKKKGQAAAAGAVVGALAGGLLGGAAGDSVAKKKESYAIKEDAIQTRKKVADRELATRRSYNQELSGAIAKKEQQLATVQAAAASPGLAVEEFELRRFVAAKLDETERQSRSWQEAIDAHKAALARLDSDSESKTMGANIDGLTQEREELLRQRERLMSISQKLNAKPAP